MEREDWIIGIDLATGPDYSLMNAGSVVCNAKWKWQEVPKQNKKNADIEKLKHLIQNGLIKFGIKNKLVEEIQCLRLGIGVKLR